MQGGFCLTACIKCFVNKTFFVANQALRLSFLIEMKAFNIPASNILMADYPLRFSSSVEGEAWFLCSLAASSLFTIRGSDRGVVLL